MLVGVAEDRVAVPPVIEKAKSAESSAPLPPLVLYAVSEPENLTSIVLLLEARAITVNVGLALSFNVAVLLL